MTQSDDHLTLKLPWPSASKMGKPPYALWVEPDSAICHDVSLQQIRAGHLDTEVEHFFTRANLLMKRSNCMLANG